MKEEVHKCKRCGTTTGGEWYGETKKTLFGEKMIWQCGTCAKSEFCNAINQSPSLVAQYWNTYHKSPEEVLKLIKK